MKTFIFAKKNAFTLAEGATHVALQRECRKIAFTLAEVLITLAVIGVVAALTIPPLVQSYKKSVVETRLKKFYSVMNQAIALSEIDNGDRKLWYKDLKSAQTDDDGNYIEGSSESEKWFKKYLAPYLNIAEMKVSDTDGYLYVYFADGSAFRIPNTTRNVDFFVTGDKCIKKPVRGVCMFFFNYYPIAKNTTIADEFAYSTQNLEPWVWKWDGTKELLYKSCSGSLSKTESNYYKNFCSRLIMLNNWKIPDDYPLKF